MSENQPSPAFLDVRREADFAQCHRCGTANIPLEELAERICELPPPYEPLVVFDAEDTRAAHAAEQLRQRGRIVVAVEHGAAWLTEGATESGPCRVRLWRCHALLAEAIALAQAEWGDVNDRTALDIACGTGRDTVHLAMAGFRVEAIDVLPDALRRCEDLARRNGVRVSTRSVDVEADGLYVEKAYDLVCCFNFLCRPLMPAIASAVRPGGFVVYETFVHPQVAVYGKPSRDSHVLKPGELPTHFPGWDLRLVREGETGPRRIAASLIAQKPQASQD